MEEQKYINYACEVLQIANRTSYGFSDIINGYERGEEPEDKPQAGMVDSLRGSIAALRDYCNRVETDINAVWEGGEGDE